VKAKGVRHCVGAIVNAKLGCSLFHVAAYGFFAQFKARCSFFDALPDRLATQHR
jgi:hypothetical protein